MGFPKIPQYFFGNDSQVSKFWTKIIRSSQYGKKYGFNF
jgi:hypothetical protein